MRTGRGRNAAASRCLAAVVALALIAAALCRAPASQAAPALPRPGASIGTGYYQTCAVESGQAYCWGPNGDGELGDGSLASSGVPVAVDTSGALASKTLRQVSGGDEFACALDTSGAAYCWGSNDNGQLGDGSAVSYTDVPVPVDTSGVLSGKTLVQIAAGQQGACVLDTAGQVFCWGDNTEGELGDGSTTQSRVPVAVDTSGALAGKTVTQITAGELYACALDSAGAAYCWGFNDFGQLGDGSTANSSAPVAVQTGGALAGRALAGIAASDSEVFTCAVDTAGAAYCWGINFFGQLGDGTTANSSAPVAVDASGALAGKKLAQISAGGFFWTCATDASGAVYCWGDNLGGQLGDDSTASQSDVPLKAGPSPPTSVTAVPGHAAATVSWAAPALTGASLTGYTAFASPGGEICITATTTCTITGLTDDTTYSVTVVAHTSATNSAASTAASVTPGSGVAFTSSPSDTVRFGKPFSFTVRASGSPAPKITRAGRLPCGVIFTSNSNGTATIAGTPAHAAAGNYPLTLTAKSKAGMATQAFTLTVTRTPVLKKIPATTTRVGAAVNLAIAATGYPVPSLTETGPLPDGVRLIDRGNGTGAITGIPAPGSGGSYRITVTAASTAGTARQSFTLKVGQPPAITSAGTTAVVIGYVFAFRVTATGYPAPSITESGHLPRGVMYNSATATLNGIPRSGTAGSYPIVITARNAAGTTTQHFTLTVT
jgi:hypothetical protein